MLRFYPKRKEIEFFKGILLDVDKSAAGEWLSVVGFVGENEEINSCGELFPFADDSCGVRNATENIIYVVIVLIFKYFESHLVENLQVSVLKVFYIMDIEDVFASILRRNSVKERGLGDDSHGLGVLGFISAGIGGYPSEISAYFFALG